MSLVDRIIGTYLVIRSEHLMQHPVHKQDDVAVLLSKLTLSSNSILLGTILSRIESHALEIKDASLIVEAAELRALWNSYRNFKPSMV